MTANDASMKRNKGSILRRVAHWVVICERIADTVSGSASSLVASRANRAGDASAGFVRVASSRSENMVAGVCRKINMNTEVICSGCETTTIPGSSLGGGT
jgi:hypothetical protein